VVVRGLGLFLDNFDGLAIIAAQQLINHTLQKSGKSWKAKRRLI